MNAQVLNYKFDCSENLEHVKSYEGSTTSLIEHWSS